MAVAHQAKRPGFRESAIADAKYVADEFGKIRLIDFIFGIAMIQQSLIVGGMPLGNLAAGVLVFLAFNRKTDFYNRHSGAFTSLIVLAIFYTASTSVLFGISTTGETIRRAIKIGIVVGVALLLADKRIDFRSLILGMTSGLIANVPVFYAGLNSNTYGGYLTGWVPDKNQAGLWYATVGLLMVMSLKKRNHRILAIITFLVLIYLTGSRTSTAAYLFGLLWMIIARYLNLLMKLGLGAFIIWAVDWLTQNLAQNEAFGDRTGTDALRQRIDEAAWAKVQSAPFTGLGYGQATVKVEELTFFFHNSFWTLLVEGGWVYAIAIVGLTVWAVFLLRQPQEHKTNQYGTDIDVKKIHQRMVLGEAGMVLLFICSWRLGEVFLTIPWALAMGLALSMLSTPIEKTEQQLSN